MGFTRISQAVVISNICVSIFTIGLITTLPWKYKKLHTSPVIMSLMVTVYLLGNTSQAAVGSVLLAKGHNSSDNITKLIHSIFTCIILFLIIVLLYI
jgi:dipeptide/tripeptide permease